MFNTITIKVSMVDKLPDNQQQALRRKLGIWFMQPVVEHGDHWEIRAYPIKDMMDCKALTYLMSCYQSLTNEYPTVSLSAVLSEEPASMEQCKAIIDQLLQEWQTVYTQLTERIEANTEAVLCLMSYMGEQSAFARALKELGGITEETELSIERILTMRYVLYNEYLLATDVYRKRRAERNEEVIDQLYMSRGRCEAFAAILQEISEGFRIPPLPLTHHKGDIDV